MQLKAIVKMKQKTAYATQSVITLCHKEQDRRAWENELIQQLKSPAVTQSGQMTKSLTQLFRKIDQIASSVQNS